MTDISKVVSDGADQINDQLDRLVATITGGGNVGAKRRATESKGPTIHAVSWVDGEGREQILVPKADLDVANKRIRELTGAVDDRAGRYRAYLARIARVIGVNGEQGGGYFYAELPQAVAQYGTDCHQAGYARGETAVRESQEMKLAVAHRNDCMKYEGIIEATMDALGVEKYGELPDAARNARLVAEWLIAEVRHRYSQLYDWMRADLDGISPEATQPAHLRFAATIIEQTAVPKDHGGNGEDQGRTARQLRDEADRIEGERRTTESVTIATPTINHLGPRDTVASTYRRAAWNLRNGYDAGGSNMRESIATTLDRVADAMTGVSR